MARYRAGSRGGAAGGIGGAGGGGTVASVNTRKRQNKSMSRLRYQDDGAHGE